MLAADGARGDDRRLEHPHLALGAVVRRADVRGARVGRDDDARGERGVTRDALPDLLRDERDRSGGAGAGRPRARARAPRASRRPARRRLDASSGLRQLEVPVAELVPEEVVERAGRVVEPELLEAAVRRVGGGGEARRGSSGSRSARRRRAAPRRQAARPPAPPRACRARSAPRSRACCRSCGTPRCAWATARCACALRRVARAA